MANFHPSDNTLVEFSSGTLDWALSLCVSAHLELCLSCRHKVKHLNAIGGELLENTESLEVSESSFENIMDKIKTSHKKTDEPPLVADTPATKTPPHTAKQTKSLPKVIKKLLPPNEPLKWKKISWSLQEAQLNTGQEKYEVCFHKIKPGGKAARHGHKGLEVTLVLEGSFSDEQGTYVRGDYIEREPGDIHRPLATQNQSCLCFSVVAAPVHITGLLGKVINPFISFNPR